MKLFWHVRLHEPHFTGHSPAIDYKAVQKKGIAEFSSFSPVASFYAGLISYKYRRKNLF